MDWRRYAPKMRYEVARLPRRVKDGCVKVVRELGLDYSGVDLIETPDGEHVFLEANSLPAWLWLEDETRLPMTRAIAGRILEKARKR